MDLNDVRIAVTLVSLALFIGLMLHTYSRRRRPEFEAAAMLPFVGDDVPIDAGSVGRDVKPEARP